MSVHHRSLRLAAAVAVAAVLGATLGAPPGQAQSGTIVGAGAPDAIPNSYLVVLNDAAVADRGVAVSAADLAARLGGQIEHRYHAALKGFSVTMSEPAARRLAGDPAVAYVEQNRTVRIAGTQLNPPSWGLDRIDQRNLPLDNRYVFPNTASNVRAYVLDTGIRITHNDFGGRATHGRDTIDNDNDSSDCNGHGTHVAGTIGGTAHGVAKEVRLVAVRVLNCAGAGSTASVVAGVDWVTANAIRPAVANMSLGGPGNTTIDNAVANSIAAGITYTVAAGNNNSNACNFSPARTPAAITVGSAQITDARAGSSNFGSCLDLFAPGVGITSTWWTSNSATNTISGTSMAAPHVAGAAAMLYSTNPSWTPAQVRNRIVADATTGKVTNPGSGSPNRLLFVGSVAGPPTITSLHCDGLRGRVVCSLSADGWTQIRWFVNGNHVSRWDNQLGMFDSCGGSLASVRVDVSNAHGTTSRSTGVACS